MTYRLRIAWERRKLAMSEWFYTHVLNRIAPHHWPIDESFDSQQEVDEWLEKQWNQPLDLRPPRKPDFWEGPRSVPNPRKPH